MRPCMGCTTGGQFPEGMVMNGWFRELAVQKVSKSKKTGCATH